MSSEDISKEDKRIPINLASFVREAEEAIRNYGFSGLVIIGGSLEEQEKLEKAFRDHIKEKYPVLHREKHIRGYCSIDLRKSRIV